MCYVFNKGTPFTARHFPLNTSFLLLPNRSIRAVVFPAFCTSFHSVSLSRFRAMQHPSTYQPHSFLRCFSLDGSASTNLQEEIDACTSFDAAVDLIPVFPVFFVISL